MRGKGIHGTDFRQWPVADSRQSAENQKEPYLSRPFLSSHADLDLDFDENFRPVLITQLLNACLRRNDGTTYCDHEIWHWSLKERLQGLLAIVVATRGPYLKLQAYCTQTDCRELMEFELDLTRFIQAEPSISFFCRPDPETELELRHPSGLDQLNWINNQADWANNWFSEMASSLVCRVNGETPSRRFRVSEDWLDSIGMALEQHDDLMTLEVNAGCPACGQDLLIDLDLEEKLLENLATEQKRLLRQIHRLARAYHWSEADIVAMPNRRRQYYLAQIDGESVP